MNHPLLFDIRFRVAKQPAFMNCTYDKPYRTAVVTYRGNTLDEARNLAARAKVKFDHRRFETKCWYIPAIVTKPKDRSAEDIADKRFSYHVTIDTNDYTKALSSSTTYAQLKAIMGKGLIPYRIQWAGKHIDYTEESVRDIVWKFFHHFYGQWYEMVPTDDGRACMRIMFPGLQEAIHTDDNFDESVPFNVSQFGAKLSLKM